MPGSNCTAVIFHLAGRQDRLYVSPLNIIYNALSKFRTYFPHTIECSSDFGYLPYLYLLYIQVPDISNSKLRDVCLDCLALIVITFKPPASRSHAYCDCNPIRAFETFYIFKELISKTSRFWTFWYKRGCNWLSAIKGMALWSRGFSRGSLFNSFVTKPRRLVQICTTPV